MSDDGQPRRQRKPSVEADQEPVLPEVAKEDSDDGWGDERDGGRRDEHWYRRERPPHHE